MAIPFHKPFIGDEEIFEVVDSLKSGWLTMGPKTVRFEEEFGRYIGSPHSVSVNSCTAALHLALRVIGLKSDDEVIVPVMTFASTAEVVCYFGAKPVFVDVDKDTGNMAVDSLERAITAKTKAIIPVHYGGQPCDMDEIMALARARDLKVIEDAAHSLPAWYKGRKIGTIGDMTCFSFYATKTLSTGEGGMVTTESKEWAEKIKVLRLHGISKDAWKRYSNEGSWYYEIVDAGYKYNMTDIQAGLGVAQLKRLEWMRDERKRIAERYTEAFRDTGFFVTPVERPDRVHAWHLYVIKLNLEALTIDRARFIDELRQREIGTSVHFIPLYRHPFYRDTFGYVPDSFPTAERTYERVISLPLFPGMTEEDINTVIEVVCDTAKRFKR